MNLVATRAPAQPRTPPDCCMGHGLADNHPDHFTTPRSQRHADRDLCGVPSSSTVFSLRQSR
jgi:hypothetical protein